MEKVLVVYDTAISHRQFLPLTFTRPVGHLLAGMLSLQDWWGRLTGLPVVSLSHRYITDELPDAALYICVDATVVPDPEIAGHLKDLNPEEIIRDESGMIAFASNSKPIFQQMPVWVDHRRELQLKERVTHTLEIVNRQEDWMKLQFPLLTPEISPAERPEALKVYGDSKDLVIEEGAEIESAIIDVRSGPVCIRKGALIMHGAALRGPVFVGKNAVIKMAAHIYGGSVIGDDCTAGGEIKNSVLHSNTNKAHHGYLGDSYIGAWCNWGAGTNNSNVKNSAWPVKVWDYEANTFRQFGQKAGILMGDFTRTAINSSLNSGTVTGVCCSIHFEGLTAKIIPSFSFGHSARYQWEKAIRDINNWKKFKNDALNDREKENLLAIYEKRELDKNHE